jgi:hypothetical protein
VHPWTLKAFQRWLDNGSGAFVLCIEDDAFGAVSHVLHLAKTSTCHATVITSVVVEGAQRVSPAMSAVTLKDQNEERREKSTGRHDAMGLESRQPPGDNKPIPIDSTATSRPSQHRPSDNFTTHDLNVRMKEKAAEFHRLVETTDWSKTALGPYAGWSQAIKTALGIAFGSATQDSIWFGPAVEGDITGGIHVI